MSLNLALFLTVVVCVTAAPPLDSPASPEREQPTVIPIVNQFEELEANGTYKFSYETGNGIKREEVSYEKNLPKIEGRSSGDEESENIENNDIHVQQGSYSYVAPDGTVISLRYTADENGFRAVGDHIPTPPSYVRSLVRAAASEKSGRTLKLDKLVETEAASSTPVVVTEKLDTKIVAPQLESLPKNVADVAKTEVEKKPEIAAIELAISANPLAKDADINVPIHEIPDIHEAEVAPSEKPLKVEIAPKETAPAKPSSESTNITSAPNNLSSETPISSASKAAVVDTSSPASVSA